MVSYIVDFQAFKDLYNTFILKELVIVSLETDQVVHCLVKSPVYYHNLHPELRRRCDYLSKNYHKIRWGDGYVEFSDAIRLLRKTTQGSAKIYVKGSERVKYISDILGRKVLDLDKIGCPKAVDWTLQIARQCPYFRHSNLPVQVHCSFKNALTYKDWFQNEFSDFIN